MKTLSAAGNCQPFYGLVKSFVLILAYAIHPLTIFLNSLGGSLNATGIAIWAQIMRYVIEKHLYFEKCLS